jgi:hypothetical protein
MRKNSLMKGIEEMLTTLGEPGPVNEAVFDLALKDILSENSDAVSLWELLDVCLNQSAGDLEFPGEAWAD